MRLKILLTGRNGQAGAELLNTLQALGPIVATDRVALDLRDSDAVRRAIRAAAPAVIVNAAAYTAVDKAESERELAMQVNGIAPGVMADEAKRLGALLVHYSTDYVFDGRKRSPYEEEDEPSPLNGYGKSKLEGEQRIRASGCRYLILRTSWVYGPHASNFYRVIRRRALAGEAMRMVDDQTSVPTPAPFLAYYTRRLLQIEAGGLLNVVPSGQATRYDFACEVVRMMKSESKVHAAKTAEFPGAAMRPGYSVLDNRRVEKLLGDALPDWRTALASVRQCD